MISIMQMGGYVTHTQIHTHFLFPSLSLSLSLCIEKVEKKYIKMLTKILIGQGTIRDYFLLLYFFTIYIHTFFYYLYSHILISIGDNMHVRCSY